jgi:hypothetical protein
MPTGDPLPHRRTLPNILVGESVLSPKFVDHFRAPEGPRVSGESLRKNTRLPAT